MTASCVRPPLAASWAFCSWAAPSAAILQGCVVGLNLVGQLLLLGRREIIQARLRLLEEAGGRLIVALAVAFDAFGQLAMSAGRSALSPERCPLRPRQRQYQGCADRHADPTSRRFPSHRGLLSPSDPRPVPSFPDHIWTCAPVPERPPARLLPLPCEISPQGNTNVSVSLKVGVESGGTITRCPARVKAKYSAFNGALASLA